MNPIARSLMAKYDKRTENIKSSVSNKGTIEWSYVSNVEQLNNKPKRTKLIKKIGDKRSYVDYIKSL